ncbi:PWI domain [Cryptosporidium ryanae]|uniref:PWI domain n=1 Tax=Cryptosporidium ryanae TaxID=515981 RepID=UPI00351A44C6|nr:PWI domain [Cryptosporidium ryanae]
MNASKKKIDFSRLPLYRVRDWVRDKIGTILGSEDEILVDYCVNQLIYKTRKSTADEEFQISPGEFLGNVEGFFGEHSKSFVSELWDFLYKIAPDDRLEDGLDYDNKNLDGNNFEDAGFRGRRQRRGRGGRSSYRAGGNNDGGNSRRDTRGRNYNDNYPRERHYRDNKFRSRSPRRHYDRKSDYSLSSGIERFHTEDREGRLYTENRGGSKENRDHRENRVRRASKKVYRTRKRSFSRSLSPDSEDSNHRETPYYSGRKYRDEEHSEVDSPLNAENVPNNGLVASQPHSNYNSGRSNSRTDRNSSAFSQKESERRGNLSSDTDYIDTEEKLLRKKALEMMRRRNSDSGNARSISEEKLRSLALEKLKAKKLIK